MHEYTVERYERRVVYWWIAGVSISLSVAIGFAAQQAGGWLGVTVSTPSAFVIFGLLCRLFDHYLWRFRWFYTLGIIPIPNLRGRWKGLLSTSKNPALPFEVSLTITQTFTQIMIRLDSKTSFSLSHMAVFKKVDPGCFVIRWEYFCDSTGPAGASNSFRHYGVTRLIVKTADSNFRTSAEATYYTEHDRDSTGTISLQFLGD